MKRFRTFAKLRILQLAQRKESEEPKPKPRRRKRVLSVRSEAGK